MDTVTNIHGLNRMDKVNSMRGVNSMKAIKHIQGVKSMQGLKNIHAIKNMDAISSMTPVASKNRVSNIEPIKQVFIHLDNLALFECVICYSILTYSLFFFIGSPNYVRKSLISVGSSVRTSVADIWHFS